MRPPRRRRALAPAALLAAVVTLLAGCVSLPMDGPVETGVDVAPPDGGLEIFAPGPAADASPDEIVRGFLVAAGTGLGDDYGRAREFLTPAGSAAWDPTLGVTVYSDPTSLEIEIGEYEADNSRVTVTVSATVAATLDAAGSYTEATVGAAQDFTFQLVQIAGDQWRVSQLEPGVLMSLVTFGQQYREASVYFLSTDDATRLVPDARWVSRSRSAEGVVEALLAGPSSWLQDGVVSAFPDGTTLGLDGVSLDDRLAIVTLNSQMLDASASRRALAQAQLEATLGQLRQISQVEMSVDGTTLAVDTSQAGIAPTPQPAASPTVLTGDGLGQLSGDRLVVPDGNQPLPEGLTALALPYGDAPTVGLRDVRTLVTIPADGSEPLGLYEPGGRLLPPSYDVQGWVWTGPTGPGTNTGTLAAVDPVSGVTVQVQTPDLLDADVVAIRLSREGARIAYAIRTDDSVTVYTAAVRRDADGTPVAVSAGARVGLPLASARDLVWVDQNQLAVLGSANGTVTVILMGVGGQTTTLPSVEGAVAVAAGDGDRELFLVTDAGDLYGRSGTGWRVVAGDDAREVTFAG